MTTHPGQALGVSLTTSRGLPVLAVLSTTGMCCTAVRAACSCCGALGGASHCCVPQRRLHFTNAIPAASCCCIHCSQEISTGFFFISVGTRPAPTLHYSLIITCCVRLTIVCSDGRVLLFEAQEDDANVSLRQVLDVKVGEGAIMSLFWSDSRSATADSSHPAANRLLANTRHFLRDRVQCLRAALIV